MRKTIAIALLSMMIQAAPARAHAVLERASPLVGSAVRSAPRAVSAWFTQKLEPAFSTMEVRNAAGARVDQGKAQVDRADRTLLRVGLKPLSPGTYQVHWRVLSVDTHTTEGDFSFRVGE